MRHLKIVIWAAILSIVAAVGMAATVDAKWSDNLQTKDYILVESGKTHAGSLYAAGGTIHVEGTIDGDLYCAGRELVIHGEVTGDVLCAAQTITIDGDVGQDVRLAGQYASINSHIDGSLTFLGQELRLLAGSRIKGDLNGAAQYTTVGGSVEQSIRMGLERLTVQGPVGGSVDVGTARVNLMNGARVAGDFNYTSDRELSINESRVAGEINFNPSERHSEVDGGLAWVAVVAALSMLVCALAITLVAPRFVERSRSILHSDPLMTVLIGFTIVFAGPIVVTMLMLSLILLPLGLLILSLWLAAILVSNALVAYWLGSLVLSSQRNILVRVIAGIAILIVLYAIPVVNIIVAVSTVVVGVGMAVATALNGYRRPDYTLPEPAKTRTALKSKSTTKAKK